MPDVSAIYFASDNVIEVKGLRDAVSDAILSSATVAASILDPRGTIVVAPFALSAIGGGLYRGTLTDTSAATLVGFREYRLVITADAGPGLFRRWELRLRVERGV